jgi:hypothetical protein
MSGVCSSGTCITGSSKPTQPTPNATQGGTAPSCIPRTGGLSYSCYCGKGTSCTSDESCTPTDALDAASQQQDIAYGNCTFGPSHNSFGSCFEKTGAADAQLCNTLNSLDGQLTGQSGSFLSHADLLFCLEAGGFGDKICKPACTGGQTCQIINNIATCQCPAGQVLINGQCNTCPSGQTACGASGFFLPIWTILF